MESPVLGMEKYAEKISLFTFFCSILENAENVIVYL